VRALQGFGLSAREARLYLAILRSGPAGAREATKLSGLHRATGYRVLSRLLARGLARSDGKWPQRFQPIHVQVLFDRSAMFLRDEIELRQWAAGMYAGPTAPRPERSNPIMPDRRFDAPISSAIRPSPISLRPVAWGSASNSAPLNLVRGAKRGVDALVRPLALPASLRSGLAEQLVRLSAQGSAVRVVLDYSAADHRFTEQLRREMGNRPLPLEIRHYTPLAAHLYVIDGRLAIRFPTAGLIGRASDVGLVSEDHDFVRAQLARFESVWSEATVALGTLASTRSFGWKEVAVPAGSARIPSKNGWTTGPVSRPTGPHGNGHGVASLGR
jgi:hypothetical protein